MAGRRHAGPAEGRAGQPEEGHAAERDAVVREILRRAEDLPAADPGGGGHEEARRSAEQAAVRANTYPRQSEQGDLDLAQYRGYKTQQCHIPAAHPQYAAAAGQSQGRERSAGADGRQAHRRAEDHQDVRATETAADWRCAGGQNDGPGT